MMRLKKRGLIRGSVFVSIALGANLSHGSDVFEINTDNVVSHVPFEAKNINNILSCWKFPGATAGAKIQACIDSLPAAGGTADARGISGAQSWLVDFFAGETKPITLLLGSGINTLDTNMTVPTNATIVFSQGSIVSMGNGDTLKYKGGMQGPISQKFASSGTGAVVIESQHIAQVYPQYWGAVGNGTTDDHAAIKAMIEAVRSRGTGAIGRPTPMMFPPGRYRVGSTIELINTSTADYNGLTISGSGWNEGSTPATNNGSWIEYTADSGSLFKIRGRASDVGFIMKLIMKNIGLLAVDTNYSGSLVELRTVGRSVFENVAFFGRLDAIPKTGSRVVSGNQWVDLTFSSCWFHSAQYGFLQVPYSGFSSFANVVTFEKSWFNRLDTSVHITLAPQTIRLTQIVGEPSADNSESSFKISGMAPVIENSWFGDGNDSGTWIILNGPLAARVSGNYIAGGAVGILVTGGAARGTISENVIARTDVGILYENAAIGPSAQNNFLIVPPNGIGIDVITKNGDIQLINNTIDAQTDSTNTTAYRFGDSTVGTLYNNRQGAGITNFVADSSSGGWDISTNFERSLANQILGFGPGRWYNFTSLSTGAKAPPGAIRAAPDFESGTNTGTTQSLSCPSGEAVKSMTTRGGIVIGVTCGSP